MVRNSASRGNIGNCKGVAAQCIRISAVRATHRSAIITLVWAARRITGVTTCETVQVISIRINRRVIITHVSRIIVKFRIDRIARHTVDQATKVKGEDWRIRYRTFINAH